jgi:hypothetical protein
MKMNTTLLKEKTNQNIYITSDEKLKKEIVS